MKDLAESREDKLETEAAEAEVQAAQLESYDDAIASAKSWVLVLDRDPTTKQEWVVAAKDRLSQLEKTRDVAAYRIGVETFLNERDEHLARQGAALQAQAAGYRNQAAELRVQRKSSLDVLVQRQEEGSTDAA